MSVETRASYYKARAEAERAAARAASCPEAMHAHEQLAALYTQIAEHEGEVSTAGMQPGGPPRLVIIDGE